MGLLARLFGDVGKVRFKAVNEIDLVYEGTIKIESFNNSREEVEEKIRQILMVETGQYFKKVQIIAFAEC